MITSLVIVVISAALLLYWLRYTCALLTMGRARPNDLAELASANHLSFVHIPVEALSRMSSDELREIQELLERDYAILSFLLKNSSKFLRGKHGLEERLLKLDFVIMRTVCKLGKWAGIGRSRAATAEMIGILGGLANLLMLRREEPLGA